MGKNTIASNIRSKYVGAAATALNVTNTTFDDDSKTRMFKYQYYSKIIVCICCNRLSSILIIYVQAKK